MCIVISTKGKKTYKKILIIKRDTFISSFATKQHYSRCKDKKVKVSIKSFSLYLPSFKILFYYTLLKRYSLPYSDKKNCS